MLLVPALFFIYRKVIQYGEKKRPSLWDSLVCMGVVNDLKGYSRVLKVLT